MDHIFNLNVGDEVLIYCENLNGGNVWLGPYELSNFLGRDERGEQWEASSGNSGENVIIWINETSLHRRANENWWMTLIETEEPMSSEEIDEFYKHEIEAAEYSDDDLPF